MDRIIFDFETDRMITEKDDSREEVIIYNLAGKKEMITMAAQSISLEDFPETKELMEAYRAGHIDSGEFMNDVMEVIMDSIKSKYHNDLN